MTTFSLMVISITIQDSVLDSVGVLQFNRKRIASLSRQHTLLIAA